MRQKPGTRKSHGEKVVKDTPPGVGMGMQPPQYLQPGDVVTVRIDGLGQQEQAVIPDPE